MVEGLDGLEVTVEEGLVDERPQVLGGAARGWGRLEHQADAVGHGEVLWPVPACVVDLQDDALLLAATTDLAKSASTSSKYALEMLLETFHTVEPVAGSTKPVT